MDEGGGAGGDEAVVGGTGNSVKVFQADAVHFADGGGAEQFVVVPGGIAVAALEPGYHQDDAIIFESAVVVAVEAEQFGASQFEIDGVAAVVDGVLAVHLAIADANGGPAGVNVAAAGELGHYVAPG